VSLESTQSFEIYTQTSNNDIVDGRLTDLSLTMTFVEQLSNVTVSPESLINNAQTNYLFSFRFPDTIASSPLKTNDRIIVTIPQLISIPSTPLCVGNLSLATILTCSLSNRNLTVIVTPKSGSSISAGEIVSFHIPNMINTGTTEPSSNFTFEMRSSTGFLIQNYLQTVRVTTAEASLFKNISIQTSNQIAGVETSVTISMRNTF